MADDPLVINEKGSIFGIVRRDEGGEPYLFGEGYDFTCLRVRGQWEKSRAKAKGEGGRNQRKPTRRDGRRKAERRN